MRLADGLIRKDVQSAVKAHRAHINMRGRASVVATKRTSFAPRTMGE